MARSTNNESSATFSLVGEDYTLAHALVAMLNRNPHVEFCGASAPHPSDDFINIRIQTTGEITAKQALKQAAKDVKNVCEHIREEFRIDFVRFKQAQETMGDD